MELSNRPIIIEESDPLYQRFMIDNPENQTLYMHQYIKVNEIPYETQTIILINTKLIPTGESHKHVQPKKDAVLVITGTGDLRIDTVYCEGIKELTERFYIRGIFFQDLEITPKALLFCLETLKNELTSLEFNNCPLDKQHLAILNHKLPEITSLKNLALNYIEPDMENPFPHEELNEIPSFNTNFTFLEHIQNLASLSLTGISLSEKDITSFQKEKKTLSTLILNELRISKQAFEKIIENIALSFPNLKVLSLAKNNFNPIFFLELEDKFLPNTIQIIDLSDTNITDKHVQHIFLKNKHLDMKSIRGLYLRNNLIKSLPLTDKNPLNKILSEKAIEALDLSQNALDKKNIDSVLSNAPLETQIDIGLQRSDPKLSEKAAARPNLRALNILDEKGQANKGMLLTVLNKNTEDVANSAVTKSIPEEEKTQAARAIIKSLTFARRFLDTHYQRGNIFFLDYDNLFPNCDLREIDNALKDAEPAESTPLINTYSSQFIDLARSNENYGLNWAAKTFKEQKKLFQKLMTSLGYPPRIRINKEDHSEEHIFRVLLEDNTVSSDVKAATFSVVWHEELEMINVRFILSDDWFLPKDQRVNRVAANNTDLLVCICNFLNNSLKEMVFELNAEGWDSNNLDSDEIYFIDVSFRMDFFMAGPTNIMKVLLPLIDQGFIVLKILQKLDLFDRDEIPDNVDLFARELKKVIKGEIKKFRESKSYDDFMKN